MKSIVDLETLTNLIYYREKVEIQQMTDIVSHKMFEEGKSYFDIWQYEVSDEIQSLASAYGERYMLESALSALASVTNAGAAETLKSCIFLSCIKLVQQNIGWYLINEVVSHEAAGELGAAFDAAVKAFVPHMNTALEALGLPHYEKLHPPIARDYVAFNAQDDFENFDAAGPLFDFKTTGIVQRAKL